MPAKVKFGYNYNACYIAKDLDCNNMIVLKRIHHEISEKKVFENDKIKRILYF